MTQASTGIRGPKTLPGRIVAMIWMVVSIVTVAVFTAGVTSALTTRSLQGLVKGVDDLPSVRVGAVRASATTDYLTAARIRFGTYVTPEAGLRAIEQGKIDAFVYDKPILSYIALQQFPSSVEFSRWISIRSPMPSPSNRTASCANRSTSQCLMRSRANGGSKPSLAISAKGRSIMSGV